MSERPRDGQPPGGVREWCREELADGSKCNTPAEVILWGKLIAPEGLGPRCYDHAAKHVGHSGIHDPAWATFDLRNLYRAPAVSAPESGRAHADVIRAALVPVASFSRVREEADFALDALLAERVATEQALSEAREALHAVVVNLDGENEDGNIFPSAALNAARAALAAVGGAHQP